MNNYFKGITTLDELKRAYKKLAMVFHPDKGGDLETMKSINNEYEKMFNELKDSYNEGRTEEQQIKECPEEFIEIIINIIDLQGLEIELIGSWIWVSGNTIEHKDALKANRFMWASKKKMWYWRSPEDAHQNRSRKGTDINEIRNKYGSDKITMPKGLK